MLGHFQIEDHVTWVDEGGTARFGVVVALTDDALYAEVRELDQDDITQFPTWTLYQID